MVFSWDLSSLPQEPQLINERSQAGFESLEGLPESLQIIREVLLQDVLYLVPPGVPVVHLDLRVLLVIEIAPLEGLLHELPRGVEDGNGVWRELIFMFLDILIYVPLMIGICIGVDIVIMMLVRQGLHLIPAHPEELVIDVPVPSGVVVIRGGAVVSGVK